MKEVKSDLPPYLTAVVRLQDKSGKWLPSKDLYQAMGGALPDPPGGINAWRWSTALAMAFVRRYPEHIDEVRACESLSDELSGRVWYELTDSASTSINNFLRFRCEY